MIYHLDYSSLQNFNKILNRTNTVSCLYNFVSMITFYIY